MLVKMISADAINEISRCKKRASIVTRNRKIGLQHVMFNAAYNWTLMSASL